MEPGGARAGGAPAHILSRVLETEQLLFTSALVCLGRFRSEPANPAFAGGAPCSGHTVAFPRRAVWIQHEGGRPFVADPATVTLYNRGQIYHRSAIDPRGDACAWMAFPSTVLAAASAALGRPAQDTPDTPFDAAAVRSNGALHIAQRRLFAAAMRGDAADIEERALLLLDLVLRQAGAPARRQPVPVEAIEEARRLINLEGASPHSLTALAHACGLSPYRLCREFKRATGMTISAYRTGIRMFAALETLPRAADLSALALDAGFCSHSHFSAAFKRVFDTTPSKVRAMLTAGA